MTEALTTRAATMHAITQPRYGSSDVLRLSRVPRPLVGDGDVLVRVHAAGLDRGTEHLMTGKPYAVRLATGIRRPRNPVPGRDVAGIVVGTGRGVTRFAPGDHVYGVAPGSFAEYALAREDALAHKPRSVSFAQAAVVPISAGTAFQALTRAGCVRAGQSVLITGASGGVGSYAVQIASWLGADVTAVCGPTKVDHVVSLGAHRVIDRSRDDWTASGERYDLVLDIAGNPTVRSLRRVLAPRGTVVFVGGEGAGAITGMRRQLGGAVLSAFVRERLVLLMARESGTDYERLAELIDAGHLSPVLDRTYPLEDAVEAVRQLEQGTIRGKVAITT
ncbi:NADPH:quinone reductase-like Zn-dependent oxidoreductase [Nocardioides sp. BE266]|uniref:NAD(P)-dependent alcohol dehydrogenase n=1 Tax=Nocardioides sp. BE266 TaxID=2817725 RepID=UPI00285B91B2|nr:NAD(P)-dependent alcohol dehydrogenase [Nocardioides sp. BE266]MDR7255156.1 NADPH:quinone reductase-like Zn-dependent oxidoreductase [Nocardioides sp. BE266]